VNVKVLYEVEGIHNRLTVQDASSTHKHMLWKALAKKYF
jgi:hypothetical protein